jgi:hypothetical protein
LLPPSTGRSWTSATFKPSRGKGRAGAGNPAASHDKVVLARPLRLFGQPE